MPVYFLFRTKIWKFISFVILICSVPAKSENLDSTLKDHWIRFLLKIIQTYNSDNGEKHKNQSSEFNKIKS